ncbi:glycosyltransferase [Paraclostridium benzoelyticum]|uniref:glycosyltransferase n=1 Tax=Paraclostridium benzoelyticum TaxID=1629550 RepID=UPI0006994E6A|nr:glycosyltransferase [Paraclostridium benzoelyticum]OXX83612.1 hypothetical protein AVM15_09775 [Paraclostridium benzoelyticum]
MSKKVSIIIPVYNVEAYLEQSIESAINQTLDSIEIIAINDGSTDQSLEILKGYESKYDFIKVINQKNKGVSAARNTGIQHARGEYIYFLDSDDYIGLDTMKYCYDLAKKENLDILTFDADVFFENTTIDVVKNIYNREKLLKSYVMNGNEFYFYSWNNRGYRVPVWLNFYNTEFLLSNKLSFYEGIIHEDELHSLKSFILAERVMYVPKKFFYRRIRKNSIMTTKLSEKNFIGIYTVAKESYNFYNENKLIIEDNCRERLIKNIRQLYSTSIKYHDSLKVESIDIGRTDIIKDLKNTDIGIDKSMRLQIKNPKMYYFLKKVENKLKNILKSLR